MAIFRALPPPQADNPNGGPPARASRYSDAYTFPVTNKEWAQADEGSYFTFCNPTPGTGIIGPVSTTFDETKGILSIYNAGTNRIALQWIRLYVTAASVGDTRVQFTHTIDNINRFASGGTALLLNNPNMDSALTSNAAVNFGALTLSGASAKRRILGHTEFRGTIDIIEDAYEIVYGASDGSGMGGSRASTVADFSKMFAPVIIGSGHTYMLHHWASGIGTGITIVCEGGYVER